MENDTDGPSFWVSDYWPYVGSYWWKADLIGSKASKEMVCGRHG